MRPESVFETSSSLRHWCLSWNEERESRGVGEGEGGSEEEGESGGGAEEEEG